MSPQTPCQHCWHTLWNLDVPRPPVRCCVCGLVRAAPTDTGQVTLAQQAWLNALAGCSGVVAEVWRPSALQDIAERLRG